MTEQGVFPLDGPIRGNRLRVPELNLFFVNRALED